MVVEIIVGVVLDMCSSLLGPGLGVCASKGILMVSYWCPMDPESITSPSNEPLLLSLTSPRYEPLSRSPVRAMGLCVDHQSEL